MPGRGSSLWPTPTAADTGYFPDVVISTEAIRLTGPFDAHQESGGQFCVRTAARVWTQLWLILKALGWKATTDVSLSSFPVRVSFKSGKGSSLDALTPNPLFYELMMGWPPGWTDPERPVTGFPAWLRRSRGQHCATRSAFEAEPA